MKHTARPAQITALMNTVDSQYSADVRAALETYISDLEAKQPVRPIHITRILNIINSDFPGEMSAFLEAHIANLEARQQTLPYGRSAAFRDPSWQYWHGVQRAQQRQERALRKQNNFAIKRV